STIGSGVPRFVWNFGDGTSGEGVAPTHTYADEGDYTVTLILTDNLQGFSQDALVVHVRNAAPVALLSGPTVAFVGQVVRFDATGSDPGSNDRVRLAISFGDGFEYPLVGNSATHAYADPGTYTVSLGAFDGDGGM